MSIISPIFEVILTVMEDFGGTIASLFEYITQIFFVTNAEETIITPIGALTLCSFAIGLIWTGIRWLTRLIKLRG